MKLIHCCMTQDNLHRTISAPKIKRDEGFFSVPDTVSIARTAFLFYIMTENNTDESRRPVRAGITGRSGQGKPCLLTTL